VGQQELHYKYSIITYHCFGRGPKPVICFHGYGEEGSVFSFLEKYAGGDFTFYAIDLPFHGNTKWAEDPVFTINDLQNIIEKIRNHDPPKTSNPKLSLLGFSLGGRIALGLYELMPDKIEKLVLLAPDGLKINFWYWLATQTWLGNKFFAFTMKKPGWFLGMLKLLNKLKLVNASIFKFVNYYIGNAEVRQLLYSRWTALRKIKPDTSKIKKSITANNTLVRLVYGKHDRIILSSTGKKFRKGIENSCRLTVISSGHQVLHEKYVEEIMNALSDEAGIKNF
jgi:pimeloyl-ACP methyl ester carboxylesterase